MSLLDKIIKASKLSQDINLDEIKQTSLDPQIKNQSTVQRNSHLKGNGKVLDEKRRETKYYYHQI